MKDTSNGTLRWIPSRTLVMGDTPDISERTSRFLDHLESRENEEETLLAAKEHLEDTIGDANAMLAGEVEEITDAIRKECQRELEDAKRQLAELLEQMGKATG